MECLLFFLQKMAFTQVIFHEPGYYWYQPEHSPEWELRWEPVRGYYSPPKFERGIQYHELQVPDELVPFMGTVIGKTGLHFKWITEKSKTKYIFYRVETRRIEIWGTNYSSIMFAVELLNKHFDHLRGKMNLV